MKSVVVATALVLTCGCGYARVAGGQSMAIGTEPSGVTLGTWAPSACHDADGAYVPFDRSEVSLIRRSNGWLVLVERRAAYDSLVVTNSFIQGPELVFQFALKSSSSPPYLREYRLPVPESGPGRFAIVSEWESVGGLRTFRASYERAAIDCTLAPQRVSGASPSKVDGMRGRPPDAWSRL